MVSSLNDSEFTNQLGNILKSFVKEKLEMIMKEELHNFLTVEHPESSNSKNGYYQRSLDTRYGKIEALSVPGDRQGEFHTQVFAPYQRREGWLEEAIIKMYQSGMSTREVGKFIERILGTGYSATTISNITAVALKDIRAWQQRPLASRYSVLYLDGMYIKLRRDTVASEVIYFAVGVNEEGYRELLGFYVGGQENAPGWQEMLQDLYQRGLKEVLLGVFDGLPGLEEAFKSIYPKADVQRCVVHKVRNTLNRVRQTDRDRVAEDLKAVYRSFTRSQAEAQFDVFREKWQAKYPREVSSWEQDLPVLLTFLKYPSSIRSVIYTTNWIERTIKEIRKRLRPMNSLPDVKAAEKIVYLTVRHLNDTWSERKLRGFASAHSALQEMFTERYG